MPKEIKQPITRSAIAKIAHTSLSSLDTYPEVFLIVREAISSLWKGHSREDLDREIFHKVQIAIQQLEEQGQPITKQAIAREASVNVSVLDNLKDIFAIVEKAIANYKKFTRRELKEKDTLLKVQGAARELEETGQLITRTAIAQAIGVSVTSLSHYPTVMAFLRGNFGDSSEKSRKKAFLSKEEQLVCDVKVAIHELRNQNLSTSKAAIGRVVGMSVSGLMYYPKVNELLDDVIKTSSLEAMENTYSRQD